MARYKVTITETLRKDVWVEADSQTEAECIVAEQWENSEHILSDENFVGAEFSAVQSVSEEQGNEVDMRSLNEQHTAMCQAIHEYERRFGIAAEDCLVEMNPMGLAQYQPKDSVTPEQIEKANAYLHDFEAARVPNGVPIDVIGRLCTVYPERVVFSMLEQCEKDGLIGYVEQCWDCFESPDDIESRLYQMAIEEREAQSLVNTMDEAMPENMSAGMTMG